MDQRAQHFLDIAAAGETTKTLGFFTIEEEAARVSQEDRSMLLLNEAFVTVPGDGYDLSSAMKPVEGDAVGNTAAIAEIQGRGAGLAVPSTVSPGRAPERAPCAADAPEASPTRPDNAWLDSDGWRNGRCTDGRVALGAGGGPGEERARADLRARRASGPSEPPTRASTRANEEGGAGVATAAAEP